MIERLEERLMEILRRSSLPLETSVLVERTGSGRGAVLKALKRLSDRGAVVGWRPSPTDRSLIWTTENPAFPTLRESAA